MADRYISREAAIKYAEHAYHEWNLAMAAADGKREINLVYKRQELCKAVESVFRDTPAADVAPVVHGRWIEKEKYTFGTMYDCSICGTRILDNGHAWNYCPNCGARMDRETEGNDG